MSFARRKVLQALARRDVLVVREGKAHTILRSAAGRQSSLPRHSQLNRVTVRKVVEQLELNWERVEKDLT
jgi:hypothetical protein